MLLLEIFRSLHEWQLLDIAQRSSEYFMEEEAGLKRTQ